MNVRNQFLKAVYNRYHRLICNHKFIKNRSHICHGISGNDVPIQEVEFTCKNCGKVIYVYNDKLDYFI